ncbi:MAG TPA: NUDIX domain-containing protein [Bacteroidales bacterium]|nr:NUDIX domain-containing protein [Bacteroidales bacterium]
MFIVYYKNRFISVSESATDREGAINRDIRTINDLNIVIYKFLANNHVASLHLYGKKPEKIIKKLKGMFVYVKAAGGVVLNSVNQILIIRRRGKWDLPKGKKEKGEDIGITALREVSEECGLDPTFLEMGKFIDFAWHIYEEGDDFIIKRTSWFVMHYSGNEVLVPQSEEDITKARWVNPDELYKPMKKTFLNIRYILEKYLELYFLPK